MTPRPEFVRAIEESQRAAANRLYWRIWRAGFMWGDIAGAAGIVIIAIAIKTF